MLRKKTSKEVNHRKKSSRLVNANFLHQERGLSPNAGNFQDPSFKNFATLSRPSSTNDSLENRRIKVGETPYYQTVPLNQDQTLSKD
jgi:hypothetical protein